MATTLQYRFAAILIAVVSFTTAWFVTSGNAMDGTQEPSRLYLVGVGPGEACDWCNIQKPECVQAGAKCLVTNTLETFCAAP